MPSLDSIVQVTITKSTDTVAQQAFDVVLILGPNATFGGRTKEYAATDLTGLAADLSGGESDDEYKAASALVSQNPRVTKFKVGRIDVGDADVTATLTAVLAADPKWYGLITVDRTKANQLLAAAFVEANKKFYIASSAEAAIVDTTDGADATSLAAQVKAAAYDRTAVFYDSDAATQFADAAFIGKILPFTPGSYTAAFKTLAGITADDLTQAQITNATDKNASVYYELGGRNITFEGKVGSGDFIDTIILIDWIESRMKENVFATIAKAKKVPFTNAGITLIENEVKGVLQQAQNNGGLSPTEFNNDDVQIGGYFTSVPALADVSAADKSNRTLRDVKFTAFIAGAIHKNIIEGLITV